MAKKKDKSQAVKQAVLLITGACAMFLLGLTLPKIINKDRQVANPTKQPVVEIPQDSKKFKEEYTAVSNQNKFVYTTASEAIQIFEKKETALIFFGFPECIWCQKYTVFLDEVAREQQISKVYYVNIKQDRKDNSPEYQKLISLIGDHLDKDQQGKPRIFVPDVVAVKKGEVVGHNNTSSLNSAAKDGTPDEWWTKERQETVKETLREMIKKVNVCEETCNS